MSARRAIGTASKRLARCLCAQLRRESGIALPTTIIMLMVISAAGTVAVKQGMKSEGQSTLDRSVKRAIDASDAGYDTAVYRINKMAPNAAQCVIVNGTGQLVNNSSADGQGWCPAQSETLGDGASFTYQMSTATAMNQNGQNLLARKIVSTGIIDFGGNRQVRRRTYSQIAANTGNPLVGNYAIISSDPNFPLTLKNSVQVKGDIGSNGNISLQNTASVCGDVYYGKDGKSFSGSSGYNPGGLTCFGTNYRQQPNPPGPAPVPAPGFVLGPVEQGCVSPAVSSPACNNNSSLLSSPYYNSTTRELNVDGSAGTLTLNGDKYSFCNVSITNSGRVVIGARLPTQPPLRIYIDSPENCGNSRGNFEMRNSAEITNANVDPTTLTLFLVGSPNYTTSASLLQSTCGTSDPCNTGSSPQVAMVIYGPYSECKLRNTATLRGAMACKQASLDNASSLSWDPLVGALTMTDIVPLYRRYSYVECDRITSPSPPNTGCA